MALMIWRGVIDPRTWLFVAVASPFSELGTQTGIFVFRRLNDRQFQQLLGRLIFISGLVIGDRELVTHSFLVSCSGLIFSSVSTKAQKTNVKIIYIICKY